MITEILIFILTTIIVLILYNYKKNHYFFQSRNVKFLPGVPFFGNTLNSSLMKRHFFDDINAVYTAFPEEKYVGHIEGTVPILLIRDPDIIKRITVKDFDYFSNHRQFFADELFDSSLLMLKGDKWRQMRTTLSPAFTGSKLRLMVPFMTEIANNIVEYITETLGDQIDVGDLIRRYTNDVIASTAFGLQVNSLKDPNNDFYRLGQPLVSFSATQRVQLLLFTIFPMMGKIWPLFPKHITDFFRNVVKETMEYREKNNVERPDMIQLLMEASKGTLKYTPSNDKNVGFAATEEVLPQSDEKHRWSQHELAAQAFIFFFAGFESSASVLVLAIHQLALSEDIQQKLFQEVEQFHKNHKELTYDNIHELKYLDCIFNETLRKWSPALIMDRICQKTYELPPPREGGTPYIVKKGEIIYNMVNALHMDEKYFPNPDLFDPERFSEENKNNIKPFTFMPFGIGPRNCIASRFALLELKVLMYHLILNFRIKKCEKTVEPILMQPTEFNIKALGGSWVRFEARN